ncbi:hypothetical protein BC937DRAFT_90848 [Endogone sp. FLAS-F59071]|nr:hypothetical protein BC937DRAFT_90848 [Endogone sp. FLAS-F59071]|eukprot:RUS16753.1 hypothetical protein BC937DRAFT_90848 [Endogone sp. FLAS-F59071]
MPLMMSGDAPATSSYSQTRFLTVTKKHPMASRGGGQGGDGQRGSMGVNRGANSRTRLLSSKVSAPRPINLPSLRLEHAGLDPNVALVPTGTTGWGSTSASPAPPLSSSPGSARTITPPLIIGSPSSLEASSKAAYRKDRENGGISNVQARQAPKTWGNVATNNSGGGRGENELPEYPTAAEAMEDEVIDFSNTVLEFADGTSMKVRTPVDQKSEEDSDSSDTERPVSKVKTDCTTEGTFITPADRFTDDYDRSYPRGPDRRGEEPPRERSEWDRDHQHERDSGGYLGRGGVYHGQQQHERGSGYGRSYRYGDRWKGSSFEEHRGRGRGDGGPGRYGGGKYERRDSFDKESGGAGEGGHFERRGSFEHTQQRREGGIGTYVAQGDSRERNYETWNGAGGGAGGTSGFERPGSWDRRDGAGGAEFHPTLLQRPRRMSSVSNKSDRSSERGVLPASEQGGASSPPVAGSRQYSILQHDRDRAVAPFHPPRRAIVTEQPSSQTGTAMMTQAEEIGGEATETTAIDRPEEVTVVQKEVMLTAAEKAKKRREDDEAAYLAAQARAKAKAEELARKADIENAGKEPREKEEEAPVRSDEAVAEEGDRDDKDQAEERPHDVIKQNISEGEKTAAMAKALPAILEQEERDRKEQSKRDGRDMRPHYKDDRGGRVGNGEGEHGVEEWPVGEDVERYRRPEKTSSSSTSASMTGSNTSSWQRPRKYNGNGSYDNKLQPPGQEHDRAAPRGPSRSWDRDHDPRTPSPRPQEMQERSPRPVKIADIEHVMSKIREEFRAKGTSIEEIKSMGPSSSTQSRKEDNAMMSDATAEAAAGGSNNTRMSVAHTHVHAHAQQKGSGEEPTPKTWRRTENHSENSLWDNKSEGKASSSLAPTSTTMNNWNNTTASNREVEQHQSIPSDAWGVSDARERDNVPVVHLAKRPSVSSASGVAAAAAEPPKHSPAAVVTDPQNESRAMDTELFDGKGPAQRQSIKLPARRASQDIQGANHQSTEPSRADAIDDSYYGGTYGRGGGPFRSRDRGASERGRGGNMMRGGMTSGRGGGRGAAAVGPLPSTGRGGSGEQGQPQFDDFRGRGVGRGRGRGGRGAGNSGAFGEPRDLGIATVALSKGAEVVETVERVKPVSRADTATSWRREEPVGAASENKSGKALVANNGRALGTQIDQAKQEVEVTDLNDIPPAGTASGSSGAVSVSAPATAVEEDEEFTEIKGKKKKKNKGATAVGGNFASLTSDSGTVAKPSDSVRKLVQDHLTDNSKDAKSSFPTGHSSEKGWRESNEAGRRASVTAESVAAEAADKVAQGEEVSKVPDETIAASAVTIEQQASKMALSVPKSLNSPAPIPKLVRKKSLLVDATEPIFPAEFDVVVNRKPAGIRFTVESEISGDEGIPANSLVNGENVDQPKEFESSSKPSENLVPGPLLANTWGTLPTALPVITQKSLATPQQQQVEELWKTELDESTHTSTENSLRDLKADQDSVAEFPSSVSDLPLETGSAPETVAGSIPNTIEKSLASNVPSTTIPSSAPSVSHRHNPMMMGPGPRPSLVRQIDPSRMQHDPRIMNQFFMYSLPMGTNASGMPGSVVYSSSPDQQAMYWSEASQNLARSQSADTTMANVAMGSPSMSFNPPTSVPQQRSPMPFWVMPPQFVSPQYMNSPMMVPVPGMQWQQPMPNRPPVSPQPNAHTLQRPLMTRPDHFQLTPPLSPHPKSQRPNSRKDNGNANSTGGNTTSAPPSLPGVPINPVIQPKNGPVWSQVAVPGNPRYPGQHIQPNPQFVPGASRGRGWIGPMPNGAQQRPFVPNSGGVNGNIANNGRGGMHRAGFAGRGGYPGPSPPIRGP